MKRLGVVLNQIQGGRNATSSFSGGAFSSCVDERQDLQEGGDWAFGAPFWSDADLKLRPSQLTGSDEVDGWQSSDSSEAHERTHSKRRNPLLFDAEEQRRDEAFQLTSSAFSSSDSHLPQWRCQEYAMGGSSAGRPAGGISSLHSSSSRLFSPSSGDRDHDVVICCALRTPQTKSGRGLLKSVVPEEMLKALFEEALRRTQLDPSQVQDVCVGNALQPGAGMMSTRLAQLLAGVPSSCPVHSVNRYCSSGLQAVASVVASIRAGFIDVGFAGGVESMSLFDMTSVINPEKLSEQVFQHETARNCLLPMGVTSENVAEKYGISRKEQDIFALSSHQKAAAAQRGGLFEEETVPVPIVLGSSNDDHSSPSAVSKGFCTHDDGIRADASLAQLSKLKPVFKKDVGTTTAGNSSQVSDGASLALLARRSSAERLGLPILAKFHDFFVAGVPPDIMGIGPAVAIPQLLDRAGLQIKDIDVFEINEAFASQACYCAKKLGIPPQKLNPKGGAIALGHPLGSTGCRMIATVLPELRRTKGRFAVVSMCVGTGMGAAALIENCVV